MTPVLTSSLTPLASVAGLHSFEHIEQAGSAIGQLLEFAHVVVKAVRQVIRDGIHPAHEVSQGAKQTRLDARPSRARIEVAGIDRREQVEAERNKPTQLEVVRTGRMELRQLFFDFRPQPPVFMSGPQEIDLSD